MERMAHRVAEELGLDEDAAQVVTDENEIADPKLRKAKGWFDTTTGKITVVIPNHTGVQQDGDVAAGSSGSEDTGGSGRNETAVSAVLRITDPRTMSDEERHRRGEMLRNATAIGVAPNHIVSTKDKTARKVAEEWWDDNVGDAQWYETEVGEVEINRNSIESSLAHGYGQMKLDAITSLVDGFSNAVYLGTMPDSTRQDGVLNHYFAYPINYKGKRSYVFCRALHDNNTNRLYVHEVFVEDKIKKGNTRQTAASQPHGGISLYRDILANVLLSDGKESENPAILERWSVDGSTTISPAEVQQPADTENISALDQSVSVSKGKVNSSSAQEQTEEVAKDQTPNANPTQAALSAAEAETDPEPTEAQKEAGNYKKGHVRIDGFNVTIENPKGSVRRGTDASGKQWEQEMHNTYGYIRGTEGVDGDHIDVFFSDDPSQGDVFVVDQVNKDGSFDEHKVMYGFASEEEARKAYLSNYEDGWTGLGAITPVSKEEFKKWVQSSRRKTKPFAEYKGVKALEAATAKTDSQGNPLNEDGTLNLDRVASVDELTDEDFSNPTRNVELPALPENVDKAIGANGKPVIIKKNIFARNAERHADLTADESRNILEAALYNPNLYGQNQKIKRPYNWVVINTKDKEGNNRLVLLELSPEKENVEIVHWHYLRDESIETIKRQAEREGGHILILPSETEEAGGLSSRTLGLSSDGKVTEAQADVQAPAEENAENASVEKEANLVDVIKSVWNALTQERKTDEEIERDVRSLLETFSKPTFNSVIASYLASLHTKNPQFLKALGRFERALKGMGITVKQGANRIAAGDVVLTSAYDKAGYVTGHIVQSVHSKSEIKKQKESINSLVAIASSQSNTPTERANALNELRTMIPHYGGKISQGGQFVDDRVSINEYLDSIEGIKVDGKDKTLPRFKINGYYRVKNTNKTKEGKVSHVAQGVDLAKQHKSGDSSSTEPVSEAESALRDALMVKLQAAGIEVVTDAEEAQRVLDEVNGEARMQAKKRALETASLSEGSEVRFFRTADGHAYGFTVGGKIYIDPRIAKADTPIHEYTHLWAAAVRQGDAKAWADIVRLMQGTPLWDEVAQHYPELADDVDALADEVLAHFSGRRGAERLREAQRVAMEQEGLDAQAAAVAAVERVRQALKRFWRKVADFFGRRFTTAEEVADTVLADMLHGVKPAFDAKDGGVRYDANSEEAGIVARAKADGTYMKAPNGQPSKLTPRQWVQVRTKAFKEWFGDWEKAARVEMIQGLSAIGINPHSLSKDELHDLYRTFKPVQKDGHSIAFYNGAFKKIYKEGGLFAKIVPQLRDVFEQSLFAYEEADSMGGTVRKDGTVHKEHKNIVHYQNYVGKVDILGNTYYVRFTVQEEQSGLMGTHSFFVSNVDVYDNPTENRTIPITSRGTTDFDGIADAKLKKFFEEAKNSSRVVDKNGEPRVVYHQTNSTIFVNRKTGENFDNLNWKEKDYWKNEASDEEWNDTWEERDFYVFDNKSHGRRSSEMPAFFFSPVYDEYHEYGDRTVAAFLNIRNPIVNPDIPNRGVTDTAGEDAMNALIAQGYDGFIREYDGELDEINAFFPTQIKSAEENVGTFDGSNPDIRYQFVGERGAAAMDKAEEASVRLDNLAVAREMEASGKDAKAVKFATGWERGADGKWRYEIGDGRFDRSGGLHPERRRLSAEEQKEYDDNYEAFDEYFDKGVLAYKEEITEDTDIADILEAGGMERKKAERIRSLYEKRRSLESQPKKLDEYLDNDELFNAYPQLRNITIDTSSKDDVIFGKMGSYDPKSNTIRLNDISLSTLIHEVQHAIQYIEGFAKGGSPKGVKRLFDRAKSEWLARSWAAELEEKAREMGEHYNQAAVYEALVNDYKGMERYMPNKEERIKGFNYFARGYADRSLDNAIEQFRLNERTSINSYDEYLKIAGEVEARNVSKRLGMPADERRRSLASETEDVAREDQIFLEEGVGVSQMGSRVDGRMAEIGRIYAGRELDGNAQKVVDVFSGKSNNETITAERDGKAHKVVIRQGTENKAGTKHSLLRHYGTGVGTVTADDLLLIPEVVERGEMEEKGRRRVYRLLKDGVRYTVLTEYNNGREDFCDFYSNRKGGNTSSLNTQLSARGYDVTTNSAAKVEKTYKNPPIPDAKNSETDAEVFLREGEGVVSDAVLSEENDALGKMGIERTEEERAAFAERERARMERMAHRVAEELGLDEDAVQVVTDVNEITEPKLRKAKGWFDPKTGKITVVIPNHTGTGDVLRTMLHEAVAHKGLRGLFGKRFDVFLDNVYAAADETVRSSIATLAAKHGWDFRRATEEYLAGMADAVKLCFDARRDGARYGDIVSTYARQGVLFADPDQLQTVADFNNATMLMLADVLNDKRVTLLKTTLQLYNNHARQSASGQADLFTGGIRSREDILREVINYINDNYGKRKEIEAARAEAVERRKAESVQQDGDVAAGSPGSEDTRGSAYDRHGNSQLGSERQGALETSVTDEERTAMQARIVDWLSDENLTAALGKSRTEIFDLFGNALEPIAYIPSQYLPLISKDIKDPRIYCGMAYFIDHALRNHGLDGTQATIEDVDVSKYLNIQAVLDNPDAIKETYVDGKRTVVFVKKIGRYFAELTQVEEDGKVILHKSLFSQKKEPYAKLNDIRSENSSSEGGTSSIGHAAEAAPAISLQSRGDDMSDTSDGKDTQATPYVQTPAAENAENQSSSSVQAALAAAEAETDPEPTEAQKEAGNYKKGHVRIDGFNVTIENPKGSVRRGTDASGKQWEQEMHNTYGYIRGTEGVDGDHIDVFFSDDPSQGDVFVVDQVNKDGSFDEHKVMYGFASEEEARKAYLSNYEDGWTGLGAITPVSKEEFKKWVLSSRRKTKPFAEYKRVKTSEGQNASAYKASRRKLADFNVGDVVRDYYNQKLYRIKKHSKSGVSTIAELDAEGNEVGTTTMNTHNNSRYSLAEAPVKAETPTISQDSEQVSDQDNAPYTITPAHKRQHWNSESPLDAMEARLAELKRMAAPEQVYKEFPELAAYMEERDRVFKKYGGEDKVPQDIVKAVLDKYKDVLDRYMNVSDERREECFELEDLIKERKKLQADTTEEKSQEGQADGEMLYHKEADGAANAVTSEEAALRDALMDKLQSAGIEVVTDAEEAQRVLDEVNADDVMMQKKRPYINRGYTTRNGISMSKNANEAIEAGMTDIGTHSALGEFIAESGLGEFNGEWHHVGQTFNRHYFATLNDGVTLAKARKLYKQHLAEKQEKVEKEIRSFYPNAFKSKEDLFDDNSVRPIYYVGNGEYWYVKAEEFKGRLTNHYKLGVIPMPYTELEREILEKEEGSAKSDNTNQTPRFFRTPDGHAYGFTVGGKIYIDPRIAKADTPIHEYTHLWSAAVRHGDAKAWADIVRLMQGTPLWDEVAQHYPELADDVDALADEVLAHFSGRRGAERLREAQRVAMEQEGLDAQAAAVAAVERVRQALKRFWRKVADFFGRRFTTAEEVADTVLADMLHGVKPAFDAKDGGVRYDANSEEAGIVARAKADGTYMKAPNGQPSKLTPRQWVQVRTKAFKEWFGDWEKAARVEMIQGLSAIGINPHSLSKDELHDLYRTFKPVQKDGHSIAFYNGAFKKIYKEGGLFAKYYCPLNF